MELTESRKGIFMDHLKALYEALSNLNFEDLSSLPKDKSGEIILQVEDLQNQLKVALKQKTPD